MLRVTPNLKNEEREALIVLAERERRDPRDQAALIIRRELERVGLLQSDPVQTQQPAMVPAGAST